VLPEDADDEPKLRMLTANERFILDLEPKRREESAEEAEAESPCLAPPSQKAAETPQPEGGLERRFNHKW